MAGKGPTVTLTFAGDAGPLKRTLTTVGTTTGGFVKSLDGAATSVLKFGAKATAMGGAVGSALPAIAGLGVGLAQAAGAGLALPGVLLGGAAAMATFKLATAGFSDAVTAADPAAFAEATKDMAPAAVAAASALRSMKPEVDGLKRSVQGAFFDGLAPMLKDVGGSLLPTVKTGLTGIAGQMNSVAKGALEAAKSPFFKDDITQILGNTAGMFRELGSAVGDVMSGVVGLGGVGSTYLPRLGAAAGSAALKFKQWVDRGVESGRINEIIDQGIAALKTLGSIASNVGSIFSGIWNAAGAGGGDLLTRLQDITGSIAALVNSAQGQQALTTFFSTLGTMAGYVQQAFALLQPHLPAIASAFQQVALSVGGTLLGALTVIAPHLSTVAGIIAWAAPMIGPLALGIFAVSKGMQAWSAVQPLLTAGLKGWQIAQTALNLAMRMNPLGLVVTLIGLVVGALIYAWQNSETFRNVVLTVWNAVQAGIGAAVAAVVAAINWLGELPGKVGAWFGQLKDAAIGKATELVGWVKGLPGMIMSGIGNLGSLLLNAGRDLLTGLWSGISGAIGWLKSKIGSFFGSLLPGWVKDMLGIRSPSKLFRDEIGKYIPLGLAQGISGNLGAVSIASAKMAAAAADPFAGLGDRVKLGSVSSGTWDALKAAGWKGRAGDSMEALYRPSAAPSAAPAAAGMNIHFTGNVDSAFAAAFMKLVRTGQIQFR